MVTDLCVERFANDSRCPYKLNELSLDTLFSLPVRELSAIDTCSTGCSLFNNFSKFYGHFDSTTNYDCHTLLTLSRVGGGLPLEESRASQMM